MFIIKMKKTALILLMSFIVIMPIKTMMAQFSADMIIHNNEDERTFRIFCDENRYRYEFDQDGQEGILIALNDTEEFYLLLPSQKTAFKSDGSSQMTMSTDPVRQYEYYTGDAEEVIAGRENVNGYPCLKKELRKIKKDEFGTSNQLMYTIWYSEELKFPVKMKNHIDGTGNSFELKNIEDWTPQKSSFQVPEEYRIIDQSMMRQY